MSNVFEKVRIIQYFKYLFGLMLFVVICLALFRKFDHDEFEAVHTSWKIINGEVIYIDFFQHHHPLFYYFIAPVIWVVGENTETLLVLRMIMFGLYLLMIYVIYQLSMLLSNDKKISWLSILMLVCMTMFSNKAIEIRPDVPQVLLGMLSILFLFQLKIEPWKLRKLSFSAICLGLSFLFLQKTVFIMAAIGLVQLFWVYKNYFEWKQLVLYWLIFCLAISPYYIYLIISDQLDTYWFYNWHLNMHFEGGFSPFKTIIDSFYYNHFIWFFGLAGFVVCWKKKRIDEPLLGLLLFVTVFFVRSPYRQYFMPFVTILCLMAAIGMFEFLKLKQLKMIVPLIVIVPLIYLIWTITIYQNKPQLDKIEWVTSQTNSLDYIYDGDIYFNLFRKDIDFFWYSTEPGRGGLGTYKKLKPYSYNIYSAIEEYKPKIISNTFIDASNKIIEKNYSQSSVYPELYVRQQ
ncbi:ArnT family glycosyltransferase [Reichenbachiella sp.]